ncbi:TPA: GIY-YIG nuclease family protein [Photobacterium damselae]|uniref:GIY-YIG nuclease superfamily protein n=1 Tax=Photobacterium damselae TaxID=38293 RepID=A0A2X1ZKQ6_PHODM|nr:GIY-YIG nuclease family protein [Photobacterium damselae]QOQ70816.1 GIY-YIG nuclease family protein [Photobacterium damselae subsp. damselae]UKA31408.1 GIY-YIG nuclease family protein [Photobacterium damselae subsp. damselae]SPY43956.1 GIY-YIG nuclease superfamily protein [Photobacterium damselae]
MNEYQEDKIKIAPSWWVYLIRTQQNSLYCGVTTNIERRFHEHQFTAKGAKYLKGKGPLQLAWYSEIGDKKCAMQYEYRIKKLSKLHKEQLVEGIKTLDMLIPNMD